MNRDNANQRMEKRARGWLLLVLLLLLLYGGMVFFYGARQHLQQPRPQVPYQAQVTRHLSVPG